MPEKVPHIIKNVARTDKDLERNIVRTIVRSIPRDIFGQLTTEQFYVSSERTKQSIKAKDILNEMLQSYGVVIEKVWTRSYRFNESYMKAIQEKLVAEQQKLQNIAATKATEEEYIRKNEEAIGEVNRLKAEADGAYKQALVKADAYHQRMEKRSEAILAEANAEGTSFTRSK